MKKLSIITVNYNDKVGLEKTINSILEQTYKGFEYIIIDGNSNDGSKELIKKHKETVDYWVSEPDSGIYNAMNKGIRAATGEYVFFLNAGDVFYSKITLDEIQKSLNGNLDLYYGDVIFKGSNKERIVKYPDELSFYFFSHDGICHQSCFIKRTLFNDIFFYNEKLKIVSDWEFLIYGLVFKNISYQHIDCIVSYYDFEGISSRPESESTKLKEREIVMKKYFPLLIDDYNRLKDLTELASLRRIRNILYIKKFSFPWKLLKVFSDVLLLFLPKQK